MQMYGDGLDQMAVRQVADQVDLGWDLVLSALTAHQPLRGETQCEELEMRVTGFVL